ncbi:Sodium/calcium exchanger 3 [Lamellibrachia satsuma]|nr:Sodium/calcium exchanger 3 [Lamellibrachia satsuma]
MASGYCNLTEYKCAHKGLILPLINEYTWSVPARATIYFIGLLWCFLGVAIVADVFMCAIEKITSKTRIVKVANSDKEKGYEEVEVKVWNDTVANLTLMALGSSAPEILLSCIEIIGNNFHSGELGPSTIVGSAAFNLLVITGVCVLAIPSPDVRRIKAIKVFAVTAFFSVFAYLWLLIILMWSSPNVVELWEAIVTFLFFPVLVLLAYMADRNFGQKKVVADSGVELGFVRFLPNRWRQKRGYHVGETEEPTVQDSPKITEESMREMIKEIRGVNPHLSEAEILKLAIKKAVENQSHSRLWYRINASRALAGKSKLIPSMTEDLQDVYDTVKCKEKEAMGSDETALLPRHSTQIDHTNGGKMAVVEFTASQCAVLEKEQRVRLGIRRFGNTTVRAMVRVETIDGTAEADKDYTPVKEILVFEKDETSKYVDIQIIDDNEWEADEIFFAKLSLDSFDSENVAIGTLAIQEITIIDDDEPGTFEFSKPSLLFRESVGMASIPIERSCGADGIVDVSWKTEDMTAKSGRDYCGGEGVITFAHGETTKNLEIIIYDDETAEKDECFKVILTDISPKGAKIGQTSKTIISVVNDDDFNGMVSRLVNMTNMNMDALAIESTTWGIQVSNALNVNGANLDTATTMDYIMHVLTFGWKLIFAMIPPPTIWGGWLAFIVALIMIGLLTAIIGDLAGIFGCLVGLKDSVTAITFVALGTSLPDLFASKQSAVQEKTADNSIGNVTGSNSVNVFLGLGLPWVIAAIYWTMKGDTFKVDAGTLGFSVSIYSIAAIICIAMLLVRRFTCGKAELGGPKSIKIITFVVLVTLWFAYIVLSSLQAYGHISGF